MKLFASLVGLAAAQDLYGFNYDYYGNEGRNVQRDNQIGNTRVCWTCDSKSYADCLVATAPFGQVTCLGEDYFCFIEERRKWGGNSKKYTGEEYHNANQIADPKLWQDGSTAADHMRVLAGCQQPQACLVQASQNYAIEIGLPFASSLDFNSKSGAWMWDDSGYYNEGRCHHGHDGALHVFDHGESVCHFCCDPHKDGDNCNKKDYAAKWNLDQTAEHAADPSRAFKPNSADSVNNEMSDSFHGMWRNHPIEIKTDQN
jgi:hypothetical protein